MENVILIGMPASGKSTVGVVLAKVLGYDFIDTDIVLQAHAGCRLDELMEREGLEGFLAIEEEVCAGLTAVHTVIATGGSVVYGGRAMEHLRKMGTVVYLQVELEDLAERLHDMRGRGVAFREDQSLEDLYRERVLLYGKYADVTVCEKGLNLEETVGRVRELL